MSRFDRSIKQVAFLFGLAACFVSCTGVPGGDAATEPRSRRPLAGWIEAPPSGCALGSSGPTLNPRNAIRYARASAIEALAGDQLEVDVQTVTGTGTRGDFEMTTQSLSGRLENARIVAVFADTLAGAPDRSRVRQVYALGCWPQADLGALSTPAYPSWLIRPNSEPGRICATGLSGPTRSAADQPENALRDARLALAIALESRIEKRIVDDGRGVARIARETEPSKNALARAAAAEGLEEEWLDLRGEGPVGLPEVLYGLVCIED